MRVLSGFCLFAAACGSSYPESFDEPYARVPVVGFPADAGAPRDAAVAGDAGRDAGGDAALPAADGAVAPRRPFGGVQPSLPEFLADGTESGCLAALACDSGGTVTASGASLRGTINRPVLQVEYELSARAITRLYLVGLLGETPFSLVIALQAAPGAANVGGPIAPGRYAVKGEMSTWNAPGTCRSGELVPMDILVKEHVTGANVSWGDPITLRGDMRLTLGPMQEISVAFDSAYACGAYIPLDFGNAQIARPSATDADPR
jgi:hypothetical protein